MDESTFTELHSRMALRGTERRRAERTAPASPTPRPVKLRIAAPPVPDIAELGARVVRAPALEAEIDRAASRDAVARLAVNLARGYASASALLLVHRGLIEGLCADGLAGRPDSILFPADAASVFGEVAASGRPFRGAARKDGLDARILRALGRESAREFAVLPVALGGRVVNLLYADNGSEPLGDASTAALTSICARVASAYERLIRARKRGAQG
jgi:hypothetical protein